LLITDFLVIGDYDHRIVYRVDHTTELFMFLFFVAGESVGKRPLKCIHVYIAVKYRLICEKMVKYP
jgi:hypothetical protein